MRARGHSARDGYKGGSAKRRNSKVISSKKMGNHSSSGQISSGQFIPNRQGLPISPAPQVYNTQVDNRNTTHTPSVLELMTNDVHANCVSGLQSQNQDEPRSLLNHDMLTTNANYYQHFSTNPHSAHGTISPLLPHSVKHQD